MKSRQIGQGRKEDSNFAKLLNQSFENETRIMPGQACAGVVTNHKNADYVFIKTEYGTGIIHREELLDEYGKIRYNAGEYLNVFYLSNENGENLYTTVPAGRNKKLILKSAFEKGIPLKGKIIRTMKGGYEIQLGEIAGFCPFSHMDLPENEAVGSFYFLISEFSDKKIIVSRKLLKEKEKEKQKENIQKNLSPGDIVSGKVTSLTQFGAFVDIGGMEGLIPLSELSFQRVQARDVLAQGQEVRVKVLSFDWKENKMTLSLKAMLANPWQGQLPFSVGSIVKGKIESLKNFGIFVALSDGFTGLVPLSETGLARGKSPEKEFRKGDEVDVLVKTIDRENEKISLSIKEVQERILREEYSEYMKKEDADKHGNGISSFGKQLLDSLNKKT
ncbi:MAG: S1 RNA-binding domain-containing protein [Spirochaetia bacterium]|nr:S1 RNA-binding domain-containing protein [Spirochaetia bacterium]